MEVPRKAAWGILRSKLREGLILFSLEGARESIQCIRVSRKLEYAISTLLKERYLGKLAHFNLSSKSFAE